MIEMLPEIGVKSLISAGATLLLVRGLSHRSAAERSWIAHLGLLATLAVPLAGQALPRWHVAPPVVVTAPLPEEAFSEAIPAAAVAPSGADAVIDADVIALLLWAIPAALLLLATVIAVLRLFALRRRAAVLVDQPWLSALAHAQRRMGFKNGAALLVSRELASPVSWGLVRPTILISEAALAAEADAEAIIAHELAHVVRFDWAKLLLSRAATALFWFNPLVWILARQCHQLREEAADDAVLSHDVDGTAYAALLVGAARHESRGLLLAANGVAPSRSSLGRRVARVLDRSLGRGPARAGWSLACVGVGIALGGPLAALTAQRATLIAPERIVPATEPDIASGPSLAAMPSAAASHRTAIAAASSARTDSVLAAEAAETPIPPLPPMPPMPAQVQGGAVVDADEDDDGAAAGDPAYAPYSVGEAAALRANGVTPAWLREMAALGYRDLPFRSVLGMAVQGVTPRFVREMAAAGYPGLSPAQLTAMRIHDVSPHTVAAATRGGHARPSPEALIRRGILGGDPEADWPPGLPHAD